MYETFCIWEGQAARYVVVWLSYFTDNQGNQPSKSRTILPPLQDICLLGRRLILESCPHTFAKLLDSYSMLKISFKSEYFHTHGNYHISVVKSLVFVKLFTFFGCSRVAPHFLPHYPMFSGSTFPTISPALGIHLQFLSVEFLKLNFAFHHPFVASTLHVYLAPKGPWTTEWGF